MHLHLGLTALIFSNIYAHFKMLHRAWAGKPFTLSPLLDDIHKFRLLIWTLHSTFHNELTGSIAMGLVIALHLHFWVCSLRWRIWNILYLSQTGMHMTITHGWGKEKYIQKLAWLRISKYWQKHVLFLVKDLKTVVYICMGWNIK